MKGTTLKNRRHPQLAFAHFFPSGLEDSAFAVGEALDSMGGDFIKDGVDLSAKKLVGGQLSIDSKPQHGTTIRVRFPLSPKESYLHRQADNGLRSSA